LDVGDAIELAEILEFLSGWMECDRAVLAASLARFVGVPGYGLDSLCEDFARFRFLLGFTDGEGLFSPETIRGPRLRDPSLNRASTTNTGHTAGSGLQSGSRIPDIAAVAARLTELQAAACRDRLDAADALEGLSYIRILRLAVEHGELALIESARSRGVTWAVIAKAIGAADKRQTAQKRHADLARRHKRPPIVDAARREQPQAADVLPLLEPTASPSVSEPRLKQRKAGLPRITPQVIAEGLYQVVKAPDHANTHTWHVLVQGTCVGMVRPTWRGERTRPGWEPADISGTALPVEGTGRITPAGNARTRDAAAVSLLRALQHRRDQECRKPPR
jgi:hypothetical protein